MSQDRLSTIDRRSLLKGAVFGSAGLAAAALIGCGEKEPTPITPTATNQPTPGLAGAPKTPTAGAERTPTTIPFSRTEALNTLRTLDNAFDTYVGHQFAKNPIDYAALTDQQIAKQLGSVIQGQITGQNFLEKAYRVGADGTQLFDVRVNLGYDKKPYETIITGNLREDTIPPELKSLVAGDLARSFIRPEQLLNAAQAMFILPKDVQFIWKNGSTPVDRGRSSEPAIIGVGIDSTGRLFEVFVSAANAAQFKITEPSRPSPVIPR